MCTIRVQPIQTPEGRHSSRADLACGWSLEVLWPDAGEQAKAHRRRSDCFVKVARAPTDGNHARFGGLESVEQARPRAGRWMEARLPVVDRGRRTSGREPQRADSTRETKRKTVATLGGKGGGIRGGALPRLIVKIFRCCRHEYPLYYSGSGIRGYLLRMHAGLLRPRLWC